MCGRYTLVASVDELIQEFDLINVPDFSPGTNISPTETCLVICENAARLRQAELMRWGFPSQVTTRKTLINARAETVHKKPMFSEAFRNRRCLVPARGFYEWRSENGKKRPYCFARPGGRLLAFAGLWQPFEGQADKTLPAFTILTTAANELVASYHDRMPVIISPDRYSQWLDPQAETESLRSLLSLPKDELTVSPSDHLGLQRATSLISSQPTLFDLDSPSDHLVN